MAEGSDNIIDLTDRLEADTMARLKGGDGGGTFEAMEARVKRLEDDMAAVRSDLTDIKVTLAKIETELRHKIDYKWLTVYILGLAALVLREEIALLFR